MRSPTVFLRELQAERMTFDSVALRAVRLKAGGDVVVPHPTRIKPVLQSCTPTAVPEYAAVPNSLE